MKKLTKLMTSIVIVVALTVGYVTTAFAATPVFDADTVWEEVFNPDNFTSVAEFEAASTAPVNHITNLWRAGEMSPEEWRRIDDFRRNGRHVLYLRETLGIYDRDEIEALTWILPTYRSYHWGITHHMFIGMLIRWVEFESNIPTFDNTFWRPMWEADGMINFAGRGCRRFPVLLLGLADTGIEGNAIVTREEAALVIMRVVNMVNAINYARDNCIHGFGSTFAFSFIHVPDEHGRPVHETTGMLTFRACDETYATVNAPIPAPTATFYDMAQVSSEHVAAVNFVAANGIMGAVDGNNFAPGDTITIGQAIMYLFNTSMASIAIEYVD